MFVFDAQPAPFRLLAAFPWERYPAEMAKITGLGGIFYKVADPDATRAWYLETLGIGGEWGAMFPFKKDDPEGFTLLSPFKSETDYFSPSGQPFMINLRVDGLDGMIG